MKGQIYQTKSGRWYIQIWWDGKPQKIYRNPLSNEQFYHKEQAIKSLGKIQTEVDEGTFNIAHWRPNSPVLIQIYAFAWLEGKDVTKKTKQGYKTALKKYIVPHFRGKDIRHLRAGHIEDFHRWLKTILEPKGVCNTMGVLKTMLIDACRREDIQKVPPFPILKQGPSKRPEHLTLEQQESLLSAIPERHRPIFSFGMEYGLRVGEVRALQKDCITDSHVIIKRAFSDNLLKGTKTGLEREYELTEYAREILSSRTIQITPFVFVRQDGRPYTNKNLNAIWKVTCDRTGISIKLYNAMRHSLGCQLLDMGLPLSHVQRQLGHTDIRSTKRYAEQSDSTLTKALEDRRAQVIPIKKGM